jgi:hypothetical protein
MAKARFLAESQHFSRFQLRPGKDTAILDPLPLSRLGSSHRAHLTPPYTLIRPLLV